MYIHVSADRDASAGFITSFNEPNIRPVSNSMAAHMFDKCLIWLEHQPEANQYNTYTLRELRALAVHKHGQSFKQKTLIDMLHL